MLGQKQTRKKDSKQRGRELTRDEDDSEGKEVAEVIRKAVQRQAPKNVYVFEKTSKF